MSGNQRTVTVTNVATRLDAAEQRDVKAGSSLAFYNVGAAIVYVGLTSGVTIATGAPVPVASWGPGFDLDDVEEVWGITSAGTADVRVLETGV